MPSGVWSYSTGDTLDQCPRGVYRQIGDDGMWSWMAPLPYVLERLIRRGHADRRDATLYRLAMTADPVPDEVVVCDWDEVRTGQWANRLDVPLSPAPQIIQAAGAAILDTASEHADERPMTPRINRGELDLPPVDVCPPGYGVTAPGEDQARETWAQIGAIAAGAPKLALTLGAAITGIYIQPLGAQSFFWHLAGEGFGGKTIAATAAAALVGNPVSVLKPWNYSAIGMSQDLATIGCLPVFRDEFGASKFKPSDVENLVLSVCQGATRTVGSKTGTPRTTGRWDGTVLSTGNVSLLAAVAHNEGAARRIIEVQAPIMNNGDEADEIARLLGLIAAEGSEGRCLDAYGWPLRWLMTSGLDVAGFMQLVTAAQDDLPLSEDRIPRALGRILCLVLAGVARLEILLGVPGMRDAALSEARTILDHQAAELHESGLTPGERVLSAVREATASRPGCYPTRARYAKELGSEFGPNLREVEGWDLTGEDTQPGDVAVLTGQLQRICITHGIDHPRIGLRELSKRTTGPRLIRANDTEGRLRQQLRVGGRKEEVYVLVLDDDQDEDTGPSVLEDDTTDAHADTPDRETPQTELPVAAKAPALVGPNGELVVVDNSDEAPCRLCGRGVPAFRDELGPVHPMCVLNPSPEVAEQERSETAPAVAPPEPAPAKSRPAARAAVEPLHQAAVLDSAGLWLPGSVASVSVDLVPDAGAAYRLAVTHHIRQLWIHPSLHERIGIPTTRQFSSEVTEATALEHAWTTVEGYTLDTGHGSGLAAWVNIKPTAPEDARRVALVFPAYDYRRTSWHQAESGRELLHALTRFCSTLGETFYLSTNESTAAIVRKTSGERLVTPWKTRADVPEPAGKVQHLGDWSRVLTDEEDLTGGWLHRYDLNGAECSVNTSVFIGHGELERTELATFDPKAMKERAGYVLANVPRQHPNLDPRLPDLLAPWCKADERAETKDGPAWAPLELLVLLSELGVPVESTEALLWSESARLLRPYGERVSKARRVLLKTEDDGLALATLKAAYKSRIGDFNRAGSRIYRPDIRDAIIAKARSNAYRYLRRIARQSGRYPVAFHVDAAYYVSDNPDIKEAKPTGMTFSDKLGDWKPEASLLLAKCREHLGERAFPAKFDRMLKGE